MNWLKKHIYWVLCSFILLASTLLFVMITERDSLRFSVKVGDEAEEIAVYENEDNISFVFLPSYAQMDQVYVAMDNQKTVTINHVEMTNGSNCGGFALETDYLLKDPKGKTTTLRFVRSANVATMHIDTATGSMRHIHENKMHEKSFLFSSFVHVIFIKFYLSNLCKTIFVRKPAACQMLQTV